MMGGIRLGRHDDPAGLLVQSMDNARAPGRPDGAQIIATVEQEGMRESVISGAFPGVNHHPGWLVDHDKVLVLVNNLERYLNRSQAGHRFRSEIEEEDVTGKKFLLGLDQLAVLRSDLSSFNGSLNRPPADFGKVAGQ